MGRQDAGAIPWSMKSDGLATGSIPVPAAAVLKLAKRHDRLARRHLGREANTPAGPIAQTLAGWMGCVRVVCNRKAESERYLEWLRRRSAAPSVWLTPIKPTHVCLTMLMTSRRHFNVTIQRIEYRQHTFCVKASNPEVVSVALRHSLPGGTNPTL